MSILINLSLLLLNASLIKWAEFEDFWANLIAVGFIAGITAALIIKKIIDRIM